MARLEVLEKGSGHSKGMAKMGKCCGKIAKDMEAAAGHHEEMGKAAVAVGSAEDAPDGAKRAARTVAAARRLLRRKKPSAWQKRRPTRKLQIRPLRTKLLRICRTGESCWRRQRGTGQRAI